MAYVRMGGGGQGGDGRVDRMVSPSEGGRGERRPVWKPTPGGARRPAAGRRSCNWPGPRIEPLDGSASPAPPAPSSSQPHLDSYLSLARPWSSTPTPTSHVKAGRAKATRSRRATSRARSPSGSRTTSAASARTAMRPSPVRRSPLSLWSALLVNPPTD